MDHQKTGALIARRRGELGLTQKELAEKLNISDRTVSKWDRGAGFPDISLVEPLADALGLSVLELLHGEESPEAPPESDTSAREILRVLWPEVGARLKRAKRWLTALTILLSIAAIVLLILLLYPIQGYVISSEDLSPAQACDVCPFILISGTFLLPSILPEPKPGGNASTGCCQFLQLFPSIFLHFISSVSCKTVLDLLC